MLCSEDTTHTRCTHCSHSSIVVYLGARLVFVMLVVAAAREVGADFFKSAYCCGHMHILSVSASST